MSRRILMVLLALAGLLAMHGITATTASAAAPCGQAPIHAVGQPGSPATGHAHEDAAPASALPDGPAIATVQEASLGAVLPEVDHPGMLCLAVLAMVLLLGLRRTRLTAPAAVWARGSSRTRVSRSPRAPPDDGQSVLCRWRT